MNFDDIPSVDLFGIRFSCATFSHVCSFIAQHVRANEPTYIVTPNVDHICRVQRDADFRKAYEHAGLVLVDGTAVMWAASLCGKPLPEKLSGSDLVPALSAFAAKEGYSVFFFGAAPGVAEKAADALLREYPTLSVAGVLSPPFGFASVPEQNAETLRVLQEAKPDICFVALAAPNQEIWMYRNHCQSGAKVMIGVGAGLDFMAGVQKRAPRWMQHMGIEWLWRLIHEPRRLWRRYLVDDMYFIPLLLRECWRQRIASRAKPTSSQEKV